MTYTLDEVAQMIGCSRSAAYKAAAAGELKTIKIGTRLYVPRAWLERYLNGNDEALSVSLTTVPHSTVRAAKP